MWLWLKLLGSRLSRCKPKRCFAMNDLGKFHHDRTLFSRTLVHHGLVFGESSPLIRPNSLFRWVNYYGPQNDERVSRASSGSILDPLDPDWLTMVDHLCFFFRLLSGYVKVAIENDHRNSGSSHEKWWFSSSLCKRLPEGKRFKRD